LRRKIKGTEKGFKPTTPENGQKRRWRENHHELLRETIKGKDQPALKKNTPDKDGSPATNKNQKRSTPTIGGGAMIKQGGFGKGPKHRGRRMY